MTGSEQAAKSLRKLSTPSKDASERTQMWIALVAATLTAVLVLIVMLLMAFIEYQSRLIRYQPGIRTSEIMDSVAREDGIQDEVENQKRTLTPKFQASLEKLRMAQKQVGFRIERICSLFGSDVGNEAPNPRVEKCRNFLARIPFDGTLIEGDVPVLGANGQPQSGLDTVTDKLAAFNEAVLRSFVREMEGSDPDAQSRVVSYLPLFSPDIVKIARLNQEIYTDLSFEFEKHQDAYLASCYRNAILSAGIKYQDSLFQDCSLGGRNPAAEDGGAGKSQRKATAGVAAGAEPEEPAPVLTAQSSDTPPVGQGQVGPPAMGNATVFSPELMEKQRRFDFVRQFQIYDSISLGVAKVLLLFPPDYLAMWLLFFGGALGSMLKILFWHILPLRKNKWSYLAVEPAQGLVCAVLLFILFRSGVVLVAGSSSPSFDAAPLSPYFVAFMAIGGGLMSDQVLRAFRNAASTVIGKGALRGTNRWAVGLQAALDEQANGGCAMSIPQIATRIGVSEAMFNDWLAFKELVEPEYQMRLHLVLGTPTFRLFTDVDPNGAPFAADDVEQKADLNGRQEGNEDRSNTSTQQSEAGPGAAGIDDKAPVETPSFGSATSGESATGSATEPPR